ncbi:hypothetical protein [Actinomadura kijaniata]|uniref:hypothetical protein n=1 Tax=Actinomadura kijaniata TaxID=46161 RepID=UPI0009FE5F42|nr:hypothetical protein [Actinomadura kijaniata]
MIELLFLGGAAFAGAAHATRQRRPAPHRAGGARHSRADRPDLPESLLVKAWKSAGAPHTEERQLSGAVADLSGRAIGHTVRGGARKARKANKKIRRRAKRNWKQRQADPNRPSVIRRIPNTSANTTGGPSNTPPPPGPANPQPTPPPTTPQGQPRPGAAPRPGNPPPLFGGTVPANPPAPQPSGATPTKPTPPPKPTSPNRPTGPAASGAAGAWGARRRARARVWAAGPPINMDPPESDVEFIETSTDLQQFLLGIAHAVEDFTDEVMIRRMPVAVTNPLLLIGEHMTEASAAVQRGATVFEVIFEEAIDLAAAGIKFTGDNPA